MSRLRLSNRPAANARPASRAGSRSFRPRPALRSEAELVRMAAAGAVVREALDRAAATCVAGATTAEIDAAATRAIRDAGGQPLFLGYPSPEGAMPFPAVTCISVNEEVVHGLPGSRRVVEGDLVSIDCGVRLDGWCGDAAITVAVGRMSPERLALLAAAQAMLDHAIAAIRPGAAWSEIAAGMQAIALAGGHGILTDYVGHGIGRDLHEAPQVPNALTAEWLRHGDFTLEPGMTIAIEPMITLRGGRADAAGHAVGVAVRRLDDGWTVATVDGSPAVHVEHTVAVTPTGARILTPVR